MRARAKAILKIDAIMQLLEEDDQKSVAFEVYRAYFPFESVHKESTNTPGLIHKPPGPIHKESTKQGATPGVSQDVVPVVASSNGSNRQVNDETKQVLAFLNEKTGRSFRAVEVNLSLIRNCLKSGATLDECRGVVARKVREWKGTDMEKYLRPATLFQRKNFEQYLGEQPHA